MSEQTEYVVGRGKPPLHTRFRKGQSGNPSGKPGPAKLLRAKFQRALFDALEKPAGELASMRPDNVIGAVAQQLAMGAVEGRPAAQRLLLSLLDKVIAEDAPDGYAGPAPAEAPPERNQAQPSSLLQGKTQGSWENWLEHMTAHEGSPSAGGAAPAERNEAQPFSLVQGKKQGSEEKCEQTIMLARVHAPSVPNDTALNRHQRSLRQAASGDVMAVFARAADD
ncbi:MAG TPA: DUF5681 domain-containing protein [Rhizomicrobium sp.]|jgi:hypothetical protein